MLIKQVDVGTSYKGKSESELYEMSDLITCDSVDDFKTMFKLIELRKKTASGCYILRAGDGTILYIGRSIRVRDRLNQHFSKISDNTKYYIDFVKQVNVIFSKDFEDMEEYLIKTLKPTFNGPTPGHLNLTIGGYRSFYHRRNELKCDNPQNVFEEMITEWHCYGEQNYEKKFFSKDKDAIQTKEEKVLEFTIDDFIDFLDEDSLDVLVIRKLIKRMSGVEQQVFIDSLKRIEKKLQSC